MTNQTATSPLTALVAAAAKLTLNHGRIVWPGGPAKNQRFSLPGNIIYYMIQTLSSPELYLKLAMSNGEERLEKNHECCVNVALAKLTSKIWLTHQYRFTGAPTIIALLPQKLYKYENTLFEAYYDRIAFENFKLAAFPFERFDLIAVKMIDKDENIVQLEDILASLPNVKEFDYYFHALAPEATALTMKKICELENLDNLRLLCLFNIPEVCDVKDIEDFIMEHKDTRFRLRFRYNISVEYKAQVAALCNTVIAAEAFKCVIEYWGQDKKKFDVMCKRYYK